MATTLIRSGRAEEAAELVLRSRCEVLPSQVTEAVVVHFGVLNPDVLAIGLEHLNAQVRLETLKALSQRDVVNRMLAERMCQDSDSRVRLEAISCLQGIGKAISDREAGDILVPPGKRQADGGLLQLSLSYRDEALGRKILEKYKMEKIWSLSEKKLSEGVEKSILYDVDSYFVRAERYFSKHGDNLRIAIDDRFKSFVQYERERTESAFGHSSDAIKMLADSLELEEFRRKKMTRRGLDILCRVGGEVDTNRIRENVRSLWAGMSPHDAVFLGKFGSWSDINLLSGAVSRAVTSFALPEDETSILEQVSRALVMLSKEQPDSALLSSSIIPSVLKRVLKSLSGPRFMSISETSLLKLMHHESEDIRKIVAIKCVIHYSIRRIRHVLDQHISGDKYYYNVVHWLDLGTSMPRAVAKRIGQSAL